MLLLIIQTTNGASNKTQTTVNKFHAVTRVNFEDPTKNILTQTFYKNTTLFSLHGKNTVQKNSVFQHVLHGGYSSNTDFIRVEFRRLEVDRRSAHMIQQQQKYVSRTQLNFSGKNHCVKNVCIRSYSGSNFPRIQTEYGEILRSISLYSVQMQKNAGKMRSRITPNTDTFYTVNGTFITRTCCSPNTCTACELRQCNCVKSVQIRCYFWSVFGHFSRSM